MEFTMAKVFISYSRKDIVSAKRLTAELQKCELDFWIDWEGIPPTVDWWKEIEKGIEEADIFLFLISPDSARSRVCGQEIETAVKNGKRVIPIVLRDIAWEDTPKHLGHLNYIFIRESDDFAAAVNKLITAVQTDYEWAATHRRLQVKALDWERNSKDNGFLLRGVDLLDAEQDLAKNTSKDPNPTDLQRELVFASRKATDRQRILTTWIAVAAAIALAGLSIFAFVQARLAIDAQKDALNKATISQVLQLGLQSPSLLNAGKSIQALRLKHIAENALKNTENSQLSLDLLNNPNYSSLAVSEDGRYLAVVLLDQIVVWDAHNLSADPAILRGETSVTSPIIFINNTTLVSAEFDSEIVFWDMESRTSTTRLPIEDPYIMLLAFNPSANLLVAGSAGGNIFVINMDDPSAPGVTANFSALSNLESVAISPDGKLIATGSLFGGILLWDSAGFSYTRLKFPIQGENPEDNFLENLRFVDLGFSPNQEKFVAIRYQDILIYDSSNNFNGSPYILVLENSPQSRFTDMKFSPNGDQLAVGSANGSIYIWGFDRLDSPPRVIEDLEDFSKIDWLR
jgi:TIR domain-containing protein/WD40 domain-containing protein